MNFIDIILIVGLAISAYRGLRTGMLRSLVLLIGVVLAYLAGLAYGGEVARWIAGDSVDADSTAALIGFVVAFAGTVLACYLLGIVLSVVVHATPFGMLDGIGGATLGLAAGLLVIGLAAALLQAHPPYRDVDRWIDESRLGAPAQRSAIVLMDLIRTAVPLTVDLGATLGIPTDLADRPALVDRASETAETARAKLDSLLEASKRRLEQNE
jgi:membrane protein required for colicin V production